MVQTDVSFFLGPLQINACGRGFEGVLHSPVLFKVIADHFLKHLSTVHFFLMSLFVVWIIVSLTFNILLILCSFSRQTNLFIHLTICLPTFSVSTQTYLLRCPCCRYIVFPWQRGTPPLSIPTGRCSAIRWPPRCIVHCYCRDLDNPLGTGDKHS